VVQHKCAELFLQYLLISGNFFFRKSQVELREQIDKLAQDLHRLSELQEFPIDLEPYVKKLMNSRRRVMLVNNILQNAQERLGRLHQSVTRETAKRKALLEPSEF